MRSLLDAIIANPHDDDARLVYADALTSRGDPRGEFIVVQVELARLGVSKVDDIIELETSELVRRAGLLWRRQQELIKHHELAWIENAFGEIFREAVTFRRGFISHVNIVDDREAGHFFWSIDATRRSEPPIESLGLRGTDASFDRLSSKDQGLEHLRTLSVFGDITGPAFERLVAAATSLENVSGSISSPIGPHLAAACSSSLRSLAIMGLTPDIVMRAACMRSLRSLDIAGGKPEEFLDASVCPALEHLSVRHFTDELAKIVWCSAKAVPKIKTIQLRDDSKNAGDSVLPLLDSPLASTLESLELKGRAITQESIEAMGASERLVALRELKIAGTTVKVDGFGRIARARSARLTTLHVELVEEVHEATLTSLFATHGASLRDLKLVCLASPYPVHPIDLLHTFVEQAPPSLRSLTLGGFNFTNTDHVAAFVKAPQLSKLRRLHVWRGAMGDGGACAVSEAPMADLVEIRLEANSIRGRGIRAFLGAKARFPAIATLNLGVSGDTASYAALFHELGEEGVFSDKAEFEMSSGESYSTYRDGSVVIRHRPKGDALTMKELAEHLHTMKVDDDDGFSIVKEDDKEVLIALGGAKYEGVIDPIAALKITCDQDTNGCEVRISYFISDRHVLWPIITKAAKWLTELPQISFEDRIVDMVLNTTIR